MSEQSAVSKNLNRILKIINGREVRIVAVTKYYDSSKIKEAYCAGLRDFAESRALEAVEKINKLDDEIKSKSTYHFIGHLQTNKVKHVVGNFEYIHSVDSLKEISKFDSLKIEGLMNIAPLLNDGKELGRLFSQMRELKERYGFRELSMGMSNDFKIALDEGATMIRLGRILFENS